MTCADAFVKKDKFGLVAPDKPYRVGFRIVYLPLPSRFDGFWNLDAGGRWTWIDTCDNPAYVGPDFSLSTVPSLFLSLWHDQS